MSTWLKLCETGGSYLAAGNDYTKSRVVIFGAPMDYTVSYRPGSRGGPAAIRSASPNLEEYSLYCRKDLRDAFFYDAGDLVLPIGNTERSLELIEEAVDSILTAQKFPLMLGGEHLVTLGALRAFARHYQDLAVIQLDAHADLRPDYLGEKFSRLGHVPGASRTGTGDFQFGIRSATAEESLCQSIYPFLSYHVLAPLQKSGKSCAKGLFI